MIALSVLVFVAFWFAFPSKLFNDPVCTVLLDNKDNLLGAHIADDGQWRFPHNSFVPEKYAKAVVAYEDRRFYYHLGVDPISICRAIWLNVKKMKIISGGSTLTMQVIRLSRKGQDRTFVEKIIESFLALRMELSYSKKSILSYYASNAPFGGNVVGLDAAAWRYFGRTSKELTWAEACMLAVLPNSPSLIHLGKNRDFLFKKRNNLLNKLLENKTIDKETYELSITEPIPEEPVAFPQKSSHLLARVQKQDPKTLVFTTIDGQLQEQVETVVMRHYNKLKSNGINNLACLVVEVETGNVISYIGNINDLNNSNQTNGNHVDIINAARSTGSILKPILYAAMLSSGEILPDALVPDIPTQMGSFVPENYNLGFDGAVKAHRALARSLNVPSVKLLQKFGVEKFHYLLRKVGLTTITKPADYYGLSLILGGCEGKLWDIVGVYASMARILNNYKNYDGNYSKQDFFQPKFTNETSVYPLSRLERLSGYTPTNENNDKNEKEKQFDKSTLISASAVWLTFEALLEVERPEEDNNWQDFSSSQKIAWKTGTSFGFRDAWAIGVTPKYVVGVWVGNADGEGRPDLVGVKAAAPMMFDIFNLLTTAKEWFSPPYSEMSKVLTCQKSGFLAGENCEEADSVWIPKTGSRFQVCPYHKLIHLDKTATWRVTSDCENTENMIHRKWFVLPPAIEYYFKPRNPNYKTLPPYREDCAKNQNSGTTNAMEIIYPHNFAKIFVPIELTGNLGKTVFEVAHRKQNVTIFWHIDNEYVGQTKNFHKLEISPSIGWHTLTLIDENSEKLSQVFEIVGKSK